MTLLRSCHRMEQYSSLTLSPRSSIVFIVFSILSFLDRRIDKCDSVVILCTRPTKEVGMNATAGMVRGSSYRQ